MREIQFANSTNNLITFASKWRKKLVPDEVRAGKNLAKQMSGTKDKYQFDKQIDNLRNKSLNSKLEKKIFKSRNLSNFDEAYINKSADGKASLNSRGKTMLGYGRERSETRKVIKENLKEKAANIKNAKKLLGRRKVGLAIAGATAIGGIGYGIARKMRSDKGKRRK